MATRHAMEEHGIEGTVKVVSIPAEKVCEKSWFASKGLFEGLDAMAL